MAAFEFAARSTDNAAFLYFGCVVQATDHDADGMGIAADALRMNGGAIRDLAGNDARLDLGPHAVADAAGQARRRRCGARDRSVPAVTGSRVTMVEERLRMRIFSPAAAVLTLALAVLPHDAGAQDRRTHWGVSAGFAPRWTASATWVERLYAADTIDWAGGDLRVGVVRGSDLGGDWGVAFVKRSLEDGGVYDNPGGVGRLRPLRHQRRHRGGR